MVFTIALLAISLSLDALGVGLVYGLRKIKIPLNSKLLICFFSMLYSGGSLVLGRTLAALLSPVVAKVFGLAILLLMGTWIILQALVKNKSLESQEPTLERDSLNSIPSDSVVTITKFNDPTLFKIVIKSLGITIHVVRNPIEFDIDGSGSIDTVESLLLGFALSVDAIGVGIGSALVGFHSLIIPVSVGLTQLLFLYLGTFLGENCAANFKVNEKLLSVLPGILLIFLAIIRF